MDKNFEEEYSNAVTELDQLLLIYQRLEKEQRKLFRERPQDEAKIKELEKQYKEVADKIADLKIRVADLKKRSC